MIEELQISASVVDSPTATGIDLIVNATSATLNSEVLPIDWRAGSGVAYDLMYGSSSFLAQAASHGWRTVDGREMLVAQGARSLEFWLGLPVPRQVMREALL
jgi:shikimate 5-dehydrogenase